MALPGLGRCGDVSSARGGGSPSRRREAAVVYETRARAFVSSWKERGRRDLAAAAAGLVVEAFPIPPAVALVPVPADPDRRARRGPSAVDALARALATAWGGAELRPLLTRRPRRTRQRGLSLAARRANVRGAFVARGPVPPAVCLVDDVYTTGSTVDACAAALRRAGAARVDVVTFARAIRAG